MNILMATTFFPPHMGGVEYHVFNLSKHLARRGHTVTVLTSALKETRLISPCELGRNIEIVKIKTYFLPAWPYPSMSSVGIAVKTQKKVKELIKDKDISVVHAHGHHYPFSWDSINAAYALGTPSVLTLHGLYALNPVRNFAKALEEIFNSVFFRRMLDKSTSVIGLTRTVTDYAKKYTNRTDRFFTIPNGVDVETFLKAKTCRRDYRNKLDIPESATVFLCVGRFTDAKGILEFAEAARSFSMTCEQAFFLFVGGGPLSGELKRRLKNEQGTHLKILDWVQHSRLHEIYAASDFYVLPSKWEALPITIIEAMASGLHIVSTPVGGIPDILSRYSRKTYIRGLSSAKIADALKDAYSSFIVMEDTGATADFLRHFDWSYIAKEIEEVYVRTSEKDSWKQRKTLIN